jgi:indolepyruvate ferredoxin oxidoreductase alpha subunit
MGASVSIAAGLSRVEPDCKQVAFLGDSTFFHSGIPGLINAVHNDANITLVILDNSTTAMTGHQSHPGLNRTAMGSTDKSINIARMAEACGVEFVQVVDPFDLNAALKAAKEALAFDGPSVVVMQRECTAQVPKGHHRRINPDLCTECGTCVDELGCPAIGKPDGSPEILDNCFGCGFCDQVCPIGAIEEV